MVILHKYSILCSWCPLCSGVFLYLTIIRTKFRWGRGRDYFPITRVGGSLEGDMLKQFYEGEEGHKIFFV